MFGSKKKREAELRRLEEKRRILEHIKLETIKSCEFDKNGNEVIDVEYYNCRTQIVFDEDNNPKLVDAGYSGYSGTAISLKSIEDMRNYNINTRNTDDYIDPLSYPFGYAMPGGVMMPDGQVVINPSVRGDEGLVSPLHTNRD